MQTRSITLHGRIFLSAEIELLTGLHIGGAAGGLEIGGLDKPVIRNAITNQPYIPGSSLKGKLRSLLEKVHGAPQTFKVNDNVFVHLPRNQDEYQRYRMIAGIFGTFPEHKDFRVTHPTRLTVRDAPLTPESERELRRIRTDLPYTEIKWEAAIDRVTSAAAPRQIERVPAGAVFGPVELIYSVYVGSGESATDVAELFTYVIEALEHLEHDYLGGMGSRGNGQVCLRNLRVQARRIGADGSYGPPQTLDGSPFGRLADLERSRLKTWLTQMFAAEGR